MKFRIHTADLSSAVTQETASSSIIVMLGALSISAEYTLRNNILEWEFDDAAHETIVRFIQRMLGNVGEFEFIGDSLGRLVGDEYTEETLAFEAINRYHYFMRRAVERFDTDSPSYEDDVAAAAKEFGIHYSSTDDRQVYTTPEYIVNVERIGTENKWQPGYRIVVIPRS